MKRPDPVAPDAPRQKLPAVLQEARALILAQQLKALEAAKVAATGDASIAAMAYAEACGQCVVLLEHAYLNVKRRPMS